MLFSQKIVSISLMVVGMVSMTNAISYPLPTQKWKTIPARTGDSNNPGIDEENRFRSGCATSDDYSFLVKRGTVNKLVIQFEGGGMCYNSNTCLPSSGKSLLCSNLDIPNHTRDPGNLSGIQDLNTNYVNEFRDWHHVFIRYCTCDLHSGDSDSTLTNFAACETGSVGCLRETFNFRGGNNVDMIFSWVTSKYTEAFGATAKPEKVMNIGCSAGGYATTLYADKISTLFPESQHYALSDSAGGSVKEQIIRNAMTTWGSSAGIKDEGMSAVIDSIRFGNENDPATLVALNNYAADLHPETSFMYFNRENDSIQNLFKCVTEKGKISSCTFALITGRLDPQFQNELISNAVEAQKGRCNVRFWFSGGKSHCTITEGRGGGWRNDRIKDDGYKLYDAVVDIVNEKCVESSSSARSSKFDQIVFQKYCTANPTCANKIVEDEAELGEESLRDTNDVQMKSNDEVSAVLVGAISGVVSGFVTAIGGVMFVLNRYGGKKDQSIELSATAQNPSFA